MEGTMGVGGSGDARDGLLEGGAERGLPKLEDEARRVSDVGLLDVDGVDPFVERSGERREGSRA
jgi:hypothetical protein